MKKLLIAIMALVMAFGMAACGGSEEVPADDLSCGCGGCGVCGAYVRDLADPREYRPRCNLGQDVAGYPRFPRCLCERLR